MPILSMFYGIIIRMYFRDDKQHRTPHIHAAYGDDEAVLSIIDGSVLTGSLPANKLRLVDAWIEIHREDLLADWSLAVQGEGIFKIDPQR